MNRSNVDTHLGVQFEVEAVPRGSGYEGRFTLLDAVGSAIVGRVDSYRPATDNLWATAQEALTYATEAAHHAIEGIPAFDKGVPGQ